MAVKEDLTYSKPYSGLTTDITAGFPTAAATNYEEGALLKIFDGTTRELVDIYQVLSISGSKLWYKY
jgi:hypothetical protein